MNMKNANFIYYYNVQLFGQILICYFFSTYIISLIIIHTMVYYDN